MSGRLRVLAPGPMTTVQDAGRCGLARFGVARSGAFDRGALALANRLVGNEAGAAGLEVLLGGLRIAALDEPVVVAVTGAGADVRIAGRAVPLAAAVDLPPGRELELAPPWAGLRTYLAVRGALAVEPVLGSRSWDSFARLGPTPLRAGDVLPVGEPPVGGRPPHREPVAIGAPPAEPVVRVLPGPRADHLDGGLAALVARRWVVAAEADRVGVRLVGQDPPLRLRRELRRSEGTPPGAVQVPPDGRPIVLGPDGGTTGGYPTVAVVVDRDRDLLAQVRPGQALLNIVAERLKRSVRATDTVARLGGDEFAVLLEPVVDRNDVISVSNRILEGMREPADLGRRIVQTKCSIGIAMTAGAGDRDVDSLLRNADVAMYLSKRRGKARYEFFEPAMHAEAIERLDLKADLQLALSKNQLTLHYQPIFDLETGRVSLVEALLRWTHPQRGLIGPDRFVPLAEETGLIVEIGAWVLREACSQAARWRELPGYEDLGITVNLSVRQLRDQGLLHTVTEALRDSRLPASNLVLEITESVLADDAARTTSILEQLKTVGVKLAIDDFGTGYSSLGYLRTFPVDSIKIDRSFITEINRNKTAAALVEAVVNLAQALGAYTVAEGIELSEQANALKRLGCDRAQGYHFSRPLPAATLTQLLRSNVDEDDPLRAWRTTSRREQERIYEPEVRRGLAEIEPIAGELLALGEENDLAVMATWPWLRTWARCFKDWSPVLIAIRRRDCGRLSGYALLAMNKRAEGTAVVAVGHGSSLCSALPVEPEGSAALADAIADVLHDIPGVWSLDLEQMPDLDPTMLRLAELLDNVQVLPELRVPRVLFSAGQRIDLILSKNMRKQIRRAYNRIEQEGRTVTIAFDRGLAITEELIDEVEAVHRSRDRAARRSSDLDRPSEREFWRAVVSGAGGWEVEIATLRIDGELAAYVVALLDGDVYRVYDGRMNTDYQDYSPGRLVEAAALERALHDERFAMLDWMSGVAAEKLLVSNVAEGRARLVATSGTRFLDTRTNATREFASSKA